MRPEKHHLHPAALHKNRPQHFRLERWHRWSIYALVAGLIISGGAWLIAHFFLRTSSEFGESIHPLEHPSMQLHGALALLACFFIGSLLHLHMRRAHRAHRNRSSGWSMLTLLASLVFSAYGLSYLASESNRMLWSNLHWILGLLLPVLLLVHILIGRKRPAHF